MIQKFESFSLFKEDYRNKISNILKGLHGLSNIIHDPKVPRWSFNHRGYSVKIEMIEKSKRGLDLASPFSSRTQIFAFVISTNLISLKRYYSYDQLNDIDYGIEECLDKSEEKYHVQKQLKEDQDRIKKMNVELDDINMEDLEMIFSDLNDLGNIKEFEINRNPNHAHISITFRTTPIGSKSHEKYLNMSLFYKVWGETIKRLESTYDNVEVTVSGGDSDSNGSGYWHLSISVKD